MTAIRVARGFTGRPKIVKFAGNYHGHSDALLAEGGSGVATLGLSGSAGVTEAAVSETIVAPYNVVPALDDSVACVIVEPVAANMGLVATGARLPRGPAGGVRPGRRPPGLRRGDHRLPSRPRRCPGGLRRASRSHLLREGDRRRAAHRRLRWPGRRDGLPRPARARLPGGHVVGEPARHRRRPGRPRAARRRAVRHPRRPGPPSGHRLAGRVGRRRRPGHVPVVGPLLGLHFNATPAVDYDTARTTDTSHYAAFFHAMLRAGRGPGARARTRSRSPAWPTTTPSSPRCSRPLTTPPSRWRRTPNAPSRPRSRGRR